MQIKLTNVRLAFPDLFNATQINGDGDAKFRATFLISKEDKKQIAEIEKAILQTATAKWGAKAEAVIKSIRGNSMRFNLRDGDEKADYDGYEGCMSLSASSKTRPYVADRDNSPLAESDGKPYSGCYVNALISFFAYDKQGKGISASLSGVQFSKDGDAFGGGRPATAADFDDLTVDDGAGNDDLL